MKEALNLQTSNQSQRGWSEGARTFQHLLFLSCSCVPFFFAFSFFDGYG